MAQNNQSSIYINAHTNIKTVASTIRNSMFSITASVNGLKSGIGGLTGSLGKIAAIAASLTGVAVSFASIRDIYQHGLKVNIETSQALNGTAGIVASLYEIRDANDTILEGQDKFNASVIISQSLIKKLRVDALRTGASFKDLRDGFQAAAGAGASNGFSLDQTRQITTLIANAGKAMGLDSSQVAQEARALLSNNITGDAQIASALINDKQAKAAYKNALKVGDGYDFLIKKLQQFEFAGIAQAQTLGGAFDALGDIYDMFTGQAASQLEKNLNAIQSTIQDMVTDDGNLSGQYQGLIDFLDAIGGVGGNVLADTFNGIFGGLRDFSSFINGDQSILNQIKYVGNEGIEVFTKLASLISGIVGTIYEAGKGMIDFTLNTQEAGVETKGLAGFLETVQKVLGLINVGFNAITKSTSLIVNILKTKTDDWYYTATTAANDYLKEYGIALGKDSGFGKTFYDTAVSSQATLEYERSVNKEENENRGFSSDDVNNPEWVDKQWAKIFGQEGSATKDLEALKKRIKDARSKVNAEYQQAVEDRREREAKQAIDEAVAERYKLKPMAGGGDDEKKSNIDSAKYAYQSAMNDLERMAEKEKNIYKDSNRNIELEFKQNLINIKDYYSQKNEEDRKDVQNQTFFLDKQIELTRKRLEEQKGYQVDISAKNADRLQEKKLNDVNSTQDKLNKLLNERDKIQSDYAYDHKKDMYEQTEALKKYADGIQDINDKVLALSGNTRASRNSMFDQELYDLREKYKSDPNALGAVNNYEAATRKQYAYNDAVEDYNNILDKQSVLEERISIFQENGAISELSQMLQIRDVRKEHYELLQKQYELQLKINEGTTDPKVLLALDQTKNKLIELQMTMDPFANKINSVINDSLLSGLEEFQDGTKKASEAFSDFIDNLKKELLRLANQEVIKQLANGFFGTDANGKQANSFGNIISGFFGTNDNSSSSSSKESAGWLSSITSVVGSWFGGARATGGSVAGGKSYLVGENGPEIFHANQSGVISNNSQYRRGNNGGGTFIQNVNVNTPNYTSFINSDGQIAAQAAGMMKKAQRNL